MGNKFVDILPAPTMVPVGTGKVPLRGLSAEEISFLFTVHKDAAMDFFVRMGTSQADWSSLILKAPQLANTVIAIAAECLDDEDEKKAIGKLPVQDMANCLGAIYKLSVPDPKALESQMVSLLLKLRGALANVSNLRPTSSSTELLDGSTTSAETATTSQT